MVSVATVRRIVSSLPESEDRSVPASLSFCVRGKGYAWTWQERIEPGRLLRPRLDVLAVRCLAEEKDAILSSDPEKFFTEDHYKGFPAVLVRLKKVGEKEMRALLTAAWRCRAPRTLISAFDGRSPRRTHAEGRRQSAKSGAVGMSTCNDVRTCALALEGVREVDHWGRPAFRTRRRIFITLRPDEERAMLHIREDHQDLLFEMRPESFEPLHWGKVTRCFVNLKKVPKKEIAALVHEAWEYADGATGRKNSAKTVRKVPARKAGRAKLR